MNNKIDEINILMSTYNGEKYIEEQIRTIIDQINIKTFITIRDDGSKDATVKIIENMQKEFPDRINFVKGKNCGYKKSFCLLLELAEPGYCYYAFSDQDDVWEKRKCYEGIKKISQGYELYVSSIKNVDENLNFISKNDFTNGITTLKSDFVRHRFSGCTMIFTDKIRKKAADLVRDEIDNINLPSHDFIVSSISCLEGKVYVDSNSYILHRRVANSLTSMGKGILNRIQTECRVIFRNNYECQTMAEMLLKGNICSDKEKEKKFLINVINCNVKLKYRLKLFFDKEFTCGLHVCDLETRIKLLLKNY